MFKHYIIFQSHDIDEFYDDSVNNILEDFADFNENGSDLIFEWVVDM